MSNINGCVRHADHIWQYIKQQTKSIALMIMKRAIS
jgi:hypothetical protein